MLAISLANVIATPPPCLFCLFLYSHMCPSIIGGWPRSFVSVIQQMLHSYSSMAACRLFILPVIPFALVYIIFIFLSSVFLFLFFVLVLAFIFLNLTVFLMGVLVFISFNIVFSCGWVVFSCLRSCIWLLFFVVFSFVIFSVVVLFWMLFTGLLVVSYLLYFLLWGVLYSSRMSCWSWWLLLLFCDLWSCLCVCFVLLFFFQHVLIVCWRVDVSGDNK